MDLSDSIIAKSDQQNAADYLSGPRTFTIESVSPGSREQPVNVFLVEAPGKPYRPSKTMRRVLVALWGKDSSQYAGRQITLYCDPSVRFGGVAVGGIKISHMSHIDKTKALMLPENQKTKAEYTVQPLTAPAPAPVDPSRDWLSEASAASSTDGIKAIYMDAQAAGASPELLASIRALAQPKEQ